MLSVAIKARFKEGLRLSLTHGPAACSELNRVEESWRSLFAYPSGWWDDRFKKVSKLAECKGSLPCIFFVHRPQYF